MSGASPRLGDDLAVAILGVGDSVLAIDNVVNLSDVPNFILSELALNGVANLPLQSGGHSCQGTQPLTGDGLLVAVLGVSDSVLAISNSVNLGDVPDIILGELSLNGIPSLENGADPCLGNHLAVAVLGVRDGKPSASNFVDLGNVPDIVLGELAFNNVANLHSFIHSLNNHILPLDLGFRLFSPFLFSIFSFFSLLFLSHSLFSSFLQFREI